jgi:hypothetical protein
MSLSTNLLAYYKLDETSGTTAEDSHGDNDGTANNARVFTAESGGILGTNGADFTQGNDTINVGSSFNFAYNSDFTISFWMKPTSHSTYQFILSNIPASNTGLFVYGFDLFNSVPRFLTTLGGSANFVATGDNSITSTSYHHVVGVYSNKAMSIYVDGTLDGTGTYDRTSGTTPSSNLIFGQRGTLASYYDGLLDEVGIWSRALTAEEVSELYNDGDGLAYPFSAGTTTNNSIFHGTNQ